LPQGARIPITLTMDQLATETTALGAGLSDPTTWITAAVILFLLMCSGFFSGSETALTAASRGKLRNMADRGEAGAKGADRALTLKEDNERLIGGVLLGNNLVNILATSLATALFTTLLGEGGVAVATLVMTVLVLSSPRCCPRPTPSTTPRRPRPASPVPWAR
jgi:Mg2+/Co2+ transporter CorB